MTKKELARRLAKQAGMPKARALEILDHLFSVHDGRGIIPSEMLAGEKVTIPGFGTFGTRSRGTRAGRNPGSGEEITVPERNYAWWKPGKTLREKITRS